MDNLNPDSDDAVVFTTGKIIIGGVVHELVLTGKSLILNGRDTGEGSEEIPFTGIMRAVSGTNTLREPVIFLTSRSPDGTEKETEIIFIHQAGGQNVRDRDRCITILRDRKVPVEAGPSLAAPLPVGMRGTGDALPPAGDEPKARPAVPEMSIFGMARSTRQLPEESSGKGTIIVIVAAFLVLAVIVGGIFLAGPGANPENPTAQAPGQGGAQDATTTTPGPAPSEAQTPAPAPTATTIPAWVLLPGENPPNGIWVRITYPGQFTGTLKAQGWNSEVNSTGSFLFQLPVHDTIIEGSIEKGDGSAGIMDVEILNGGAVVSKTSTSKPYGTVDLNVPVGPAVISRPEVTAAPAVVAAAPTPDTSLVLHEVPATGIWVRVAYPGNFTGTLTANGITRDVNSTGDQFYQFPIAGGIIDGFVGKGDGSEKNLVLQVYKDGTMVSYDNTSVPLGVVEIHTTV